MPDVSGRAPYQVLVMPFVKHPALMPRYCLLRRSDEDYWQGIAGGGEGDETPTRTAARECAEETGAAEAIFYSLSTVTAVPVLAVVRSFLWGPDTFTVPEYAFAARFESDFVSLSDEHTDHAWLSYEEAMPRLRWDSNRTALWELHSRIERNRLPAPEPL